jgi:phosphatidylserine/phosphatidylglycerophosphate/cardiolipin synthase-like enzyme
MAVIGDYWAIMTGGSANIAFTSMWFHSEMNIVFTGIARIKDWVPRLWSEHLRISADIAMELALKPEEALNFFKKHATRNKAALEGVLIKPEGRVYEMGTKFPAREFDGIDLGLVPAEQITVRPRP